MSITCHLQMERWDSNVLNINSTVENLSEHCRSILAMHVLSGFDTTSFPLVKGKVSALKAMTVVPGDLLHFIGEEGVTDLQIREAERVFFPGSVQPQEVCISEPRQIRHIMKMQNPPSTEDTASYRAQRAPLWMLLLSFWTLSAVAAKLQACTSYCFCKGDDSKCCNPLTHSQQEEQEDKNVVSEEEDEDKADDDVDDEDMVI